MILDIREVVNLLPINSHSIINNHRVKFTNYKLLTSQSEKDFGTLYFINKITRTKIEHLPEGNYVCYLDFETDNLEDIDNIINRHFSNSNILLIHSINDYEDFLTLFQNHFFEGNDFICFQHQLLKMVTNNCSISEILLFANQVMENPILVVNESFQLIDSAGYPVDQHVEPTWDYTLANGSMPKPYILDIMNQQRKKQNLFTPNVPFLLYRDKVEFHTSCNQLSVRIVNKDTIIGYLKIIEYNRSFKLIDQLFIMTLSHYLSLAFKEKEGDLSNENSLVSLLTGILSKRLEHSYEIENVRRIYSIKFYQNKYIFVMSLKDGTSNVQYFHSVKNLIMGLLSRDSVIIFNDYIVVLYDTRLDEKEFNETIVPKLIEMTDEYNLKIFVSLPFTELKNMHEFYSQALYTKSTSELLLLENNVLFYRDIFTKHMLHNYSGLVNLKHLIHPSIMKLKQYDNENQTELIKTLFTFIDYNQNTKLAASTLNIHYNTLRYRIDKINEITFLDINKIDNIIPLLISKQILELNEKVD